MDKKFFFSEIDDLLQVIQEQHEIIKDYDFHTPQIEIDLIKANIRRMYDYYHKIDKLNNRAFDETPNPEEILVTAPKEDIPATPKPPEAPAPKEEPKIEKKAPEPIEESPKPKEVKAEIKKPEPVLPPAAEPKTENPAEEIKSPVKEETPQEPTDKLKPQAKAEEPKDENKEAKAARKAKRRQEEASGNLFDDQPMTLADKLKTSGKPSLHEKMDVEQKDKSLFNQLQRKPVTDIKKAIGLNDKFLFIKDLFEGNSNEYNAFIEELNLAVDDEKAWEIFDAMKNVKKWDDDKDSYLKLIDFVERRFL